jgi:hypothetical protein
MALQSMKITDAAPAKLRADGAFLEALTRAPQEFVAVVEVSQDGYIPAGVVVRSILTSRQFSAVIPSGELDALLRDAAVIAIQPGVELHPLSSLQRE